MRTKTPITTAAIATINTMSSTTAPLFVGSSFSAPIVVLVVDELVVDELVVDELVVDELVVDRLTVVFGRRPVVDGEVTGGAVVGATTVAWVVSGVVPTVVSDCANAGAAAQTPATTSAASKLTTRPPVLKALCTYGLASLGGI